MIALIYLLKTMIKNYFKRMIKKPQNAILPVLALIWVIFIFFIGITGNIDKSNVVEDIDIQMFISAFVLLTTCMVTYSIYSGTKKAKSRFEMCDANLIFSSPIKPQSVMIYGIVKQIHIELMGSIYLLAQIPRILNKFNIDGLNQGLFILAYVIFQIILCNIIKLLSFSLNTKYRNFGCITRNIIKSIIVFSLAGVVILALKGELIGVGETVLNTITYSPYIKFIPIIGWMKEIAFNIVIGINLYYEIYIGLIMILSALLLYIVYKMDIDFYEDMLSSVEDNELINDIRSGKTSPFRVIKGPFRVAKLNLENVYGAKVLFFKHMNEYFKRSFIFFINTYSVILFIISIALGIFIKDLNIRYLLLGACALMFFSPEGGSKVYEEIKHQFIFLIPDSSIKKLVYAVSSSFIKVLFNGLLIFIPFGIITKASIVEIFLSILVYLTLGVMLSLCGLFTFRITGLLGLTGILVESIFTIAFAIISVIPLFIMGLMTLSLSIYSFYFSILAYTMVVSILFSLVGVGIFKNMEFSDKL